MSTNHGADFMFSSIDKKTVKKPARLAPADGIPVEKHEVDSLLEDFAGNGKKLHAGIVAVDARLKAIGELGLTPELLVLLVTEKAPYPRGAKHKLSTTQIEAALKGLFAIGEFVR